VKIKLFRALINPRADQTDLVVRKFLCARTFGHEFRRFIADVRDAQNEIAFRAVADGDDLAVFAALERAFERVERQFAALLGLLAVMTFQTSGIKNRLDVRGESDARLRRGGRQLGVFSRNGGGKAESRSQRGKHEFVHIFSRIGFGFGGSGLKTPQIGKRFNKNRARRTRLEVVAPLRQPWRVENFSDAALVVLGHGTELNENSAAPVFQHATELRRRKIFREVREAFWKQEPQIKKVLAEISAPRIFIAPLFISEGYFAADKIPKELGFDFPENLKLKTENSEIFYCKPIGSHDSMTKVILARAVNVAKQFPFPRAPKFSETTLFIAGHGTEKNKSSRLAIERQVELIRAQKNFTDVQAIFMEESPRISDYFEIAKTKNLVVVPFFISDGLHVVEDIPVLLGEPKNIVEKRLAAKQTTWRNPTEKNGKLIWYSLAVGSAPEMADVILERVREALSL
jgi:sirohydrochlorin cobaltochelatase